MGRVRESTPSPPRGVRFALSPLSVSKSAAIAAKLQDPDHTDLRAISIQSLSVEEAMASVGDGYTVCMSESNKQFCVLGQQFHLYVNLLGSSPKVCEVDLVAFVLRHLDYFLKQIVQEGMRSRSQEEMRSFEEALLGPYKQRPFLSTDGNNLRYSSLVMFVDRMKMRAMDYDAAKRLGIYEDLLLECESRLLSSLDACGARYSEEEKATLLKQMRDEITEFLHGEMKEDGDIASHIFCDLLWVETRGQLEEQDLQDAHFPGLHYSAFDLSRPARLHSMALKVLALKDLQARFHSNKIGKFTHEVMKAALKLVHSCIQRNVAVSRKVVCGEMEAVIPGLKEGSEAYFVELDPPPSTTLLRN